MNEDFKPERIKLKDDEYILYINYFGIKIDIIKSLIDKYGSKIIVDNSQGFLRKAMKEYGLLILQESFSVFQMERISIRHFQ